MSKLKKSKSTEQESLENVLGPVRATKKNTRTKKVGTTSWVPAGGRNPGDPRKSNTARDIDDFLYPPMPGSFNSYDMVRKPVDFLRNKYLKVLAATMGNHSVSLFYCCWTNRDFMDAMTDEFRDRISEVKSQLADRASFLMNKHLGLIRTEGGDAAPGNSGSVLARVVEKLNERTEQQGSGQGFKLTVEGLDRTKVGPESGTAKEPISE